MRHHLLLVPLGLLFACAQPARADFISQVMGDNPVGFWTLDDATTTATDSSGNFDGTYEDGATPQGTAGPGWVPASGLVADFNGSGNIRFDAPLDLGANGYTIEAWIKPTLASLQNTSRIVASGHGLDGYGFGTAAGGELVFTTFAQHDYVTTTLTLLPNQWYYVGVVMDASNAAHFYVNGELVQTVSGSMPTILPLTRDFTIGSRSPSIIGSMDEFFTGGVAGISVYNTALTAGQIQSQYLAAIPEPSSLALSLGGAAALCALWRRRSGATRSASR